MGHDIVAQCLADDFEWEKLKVIGKGSSGTVFKSRFIDGFTDDEEELHTEANIFAVKEILLNENSEKQIKGIVAEVDTFSKLKHKNIVGYHGTCNTGDRICIFMEYLDRGSLRQFYIRHGPVKEGQAANTVRQTLKGLEYLHATGMAHRDIKGANILLNSKGVIKLADFGTTKKFDGESVASGLKGTPHWMAPEVIKGLQRPDEWWKADIWSLGCTVVEIMTGQLPFTLHDNPMTVMYLIAQGHAPTFPEKDVDDKLSVSAEARDFVRVCCQPSPGDRPTARALLSHPFITRAGKGKEKERRQRSETTTRDDIDSAPHEMDHSSSSQQYPSSSSSSSSSSRGDGEEDSLVLDVAKTDAEAKLTPGGSDGTDDPPASIFSPRMSPTWQQRDHREKLKRQQYRQQRQQQRGGTQSRPKSGTAGERRIDSSAQAKCVDFQFDFTGTKEEEEGEGRYAEGKAVTAFLVGTHATSTDEQLGSGEYSFTDYDDIGLQPSPDEKMRMRDSGRSGHGSSSSFFPSVGPGAATALDLGRATSLDYGTDWDVYDDSASSMSCSPPRPHLCSDSNHATGRGRGKDTNSESESLCSPPPPRSTGAMVRRQAAIELSEYEALCRSGVAPFLSPQPRRSGVQRFSMSAGAYLEGAHSTIKAHHKTGTGKPKIIAALPAVHNSNADFESHLDANSLRGLKEFREIRSAPPVSRHKALPPLETTKSFRERPISMRPTDRNRPSAR